MAKYFYSRVSSQGQNLDRQTAMAQHLGINAAQVFEEKKSGKNTNREELQRLLATLEPGDVLYIESLSRLSRNLSDMLNICNALNDRGVALVSLKESENIDTRTATGRLFFNITGAFAQYEREIAAERRMEGQRIKREREGRSGGRKAISEDKLQTAFDLYTKTDKSVSEICEIVGFNRATFYKYAKERGISRQ